MDVDAHIAALAQQGEHLSRAVEGADLGSAVPSCPAWSLGDLLAHLGFVHRWATRYVAEGLTEMVPDRPDEQAVLAAAPSGDDLRSWFAEGHAALVAALAGAPDDLSCWSFLPAPSPRAFWARRQAHETAVHRFDAELAASGAVTAVATDLAADGLDELLLGFLARPRPSEAGLPAVLLEATDGDGRWLVRLGERGVAAERGTGRSELTVRGSTSDLYRLCWNRLDPADPGAALALSGDRALLDLWRERFHVRWS